MEHPDDETPSAGTRVDRALDRMEHGETKSEKATKALSTGRNIFTPSILAVEAGVSRTMIGYDGCALQAQRTRMLKLATRSKGSKRASEKLAEAVELTISLNSMQAEFIAVIASQAVRIHALESMIEGRDASRFRKPPPK